MMAKSRGSYLDTVMRSVANEQREATRLAAIQAREALVVGGDKPKGGKR